MSEFSINDVGLKVGLEIQHHESTLRGQFATSEGGLQLIHDWISDIEQTVSQSVDDLTLSGSVEIGMTVMSLEELKEHAIDSEA